MREVPDEYVAREFHVEFWPVAELEQVRASNQADFEADPTDTVAAQWVRICDARLVELAEASKRIAWWFGAEAVTTVV